MTERRFFVIFFKELKSQMCELQESLNKNSIAVDKCAIDKLQEARVIMELSLDTLEDVVLAFDDFRGAETESRVAKKAIKQLYSAGTLIERILEGGGGMA